MKLPTLNVDVAVNTSGMKKDIERANKQLQQIGGKGLAFAGGSFGKLGSLGSIGGGFGSAAIAAGGIGLAIAGPFMAMGKLVDGFNNAVKESEQAMASFAKTGKTGGMNIAAALPLAIAGEKMTEIQKQGFFEGISNAFFAGATDIHGNQGGLMGMLQEVPALLRGIAAFYGAGYSGKGIEEASRQFMMQSSESQGAAMSWMTKEELAILGKRIDEQTRNQRESTT